VFAAAGNGADPSCETSRGPLTPASFEGRPAPDAAQCRALGFTTSGAFTLPIFSDRQRPLVYAVGGIDGQGRSLANARVGSRPRLAAPAVQGLAVGRDGAYTVALSGSSVAAAVATGAAALAWSYRPELDPGALAELLYDSGASTAEQSEFGLLGGASIRRLSVCKALARACADHLGAECPLLECPELAATQDDRELVRTAIAERRAASPDSVRVHHGAARVIASSCDQHEPGLAAPIGG
jgi:subtilisin family serine protease